MKNNIIHIKSKNFAIHIIPIYKQLAASHEVVLSKQLLRSGTAIGALVKESEYAQSHKDFLNKMYIALKEANETLYWLELLHETGFISLADFKSLSSENIEIIKILVSITKTLKNNE